MENIDERKGEPRAGIAPDMILVVTDLADTKSLLSFVISQAIETQARVRLVNVIVPPDAFPEEAGISYVDRGTGEQETRTRFFELARDIEMAGVPCDVIIRRGVAAEVIREQILATGAKRLIIGTHERGEPGQVYVASVTDELLRTLRIPIFTVGHGTRSLLLGHKTLLGDQSYL
jgi:nucleotide-binding universal stress UspA family protein